MRKTFGHSKTLFSGSPQVEALKNPKMLKFAVGLKLFWILFWIVHAKSFILGYKSTFGDVRNLTPTSGFYRKWVIGPEIGHHFQKSRQKLHMSWNFQAYLFWRNYKFSANRTFLSVYIFCRFKSFFNINYIWTNKIFRIIRFQTFKRRNF